MNDPPMNVDHELVIAVRLPILKSDDVVSQPLMACDSG